MLRMDQSKTLKNNTIGPKYLIIKRVHESETFKNVSPFLIKKLIDCVCGEVMSCKKTHEWHSTLKDKKLCTSNQIN